MTPRPPNHSDIGAKLDHLLGVIEGMDAKIDEFTAMKPDLAEFLDLYRSGRGAFKVGKWAGKLIMWLGGMIAAVGGAIAVAKGWLPK